MPIILREFRRRVFNQPNKGPIDPGQVEVVRRPCCLPAKRLGHTLRRMSWLRST